MYMYMPGHYMMYIIVAVGKGHRTASPHKLVYTSQVKSSQVKSRALEIQRCDPDEDHGYILPQARSSCCFFPPSPLRHLPVAFKTTNESTCIDNKRGASSNLLKGSGGQLKNSHSDWVVLSVLQLVVAPRPVLRPHASHR